MRNHNPVKRASIAPVTPKKAIAAMCASCMGCTKNHIEEGFKNEIRNFELVFIVENVNKFEILLGLILLNTWRIK